MLNLDTIPKQPMHSLFLGCQQYGVLETKGVKIGPLTKGDIYCVLVESF